MSSQSSTGSCPVVSDWLKMCRVDFIAIVTISFFVIYVLWGIRFTVFACKWCTRKLAGTHQDLERGSTTELDTEAEHKDQDPYHSPTLLLKEFLARRAHSDVAVPPTSYLPGLSRGPQRLSMASSGHSSSSTLRSPEDSPDYAKLEAFRFPGSSMSPVHSTGRPCLPQDFSQLPEGSDPDHLDEIELGSPQKPRSGTRPLGAQRDPAFRLSKIPPPAFLDLDGEMEPERFAYEH